MLLPLWSLEKCVLVWLCSAVFVVAISKYLRLDALSRKEAYWFTGLEVQEPA